MKTISATDLAQNTRKILDQVASRRETVAVERHHTLIAKITHQADDDRRSSACRITAHADAKTRRCLASGQPARFRSIHAGSVGILEGGSIRAGLATTFKISREIPIIVILAI